VSREFIRRSCGHGEVVYATGAVAARLRAKEREVCRTCRERGKFFGPEEEDVEIVISEQQKGEKS
jgi:hypothetical protein